MMSTLAGFEIVRKVHSQPKADVLLCRKSEEPSTHVIIKQIHSRARSPTASLLGPDCEGKIIQRLLLLPPHASILRYHSVIHKAKAELIVMEYCAHGDMLSWLHEQPQGRFDEPQALRIFGQVLRAVQFLHAHDIAHGDISLENVLVANDFSVRLCDFDLARRASVLSAQCTGKLNYMAPEVVRGDLYNPVQAEIWSLGIMLFMLLTGSPLFEIAAPEDPAYTCIQRLGVGGVLENWGLAYAVGDETIALLEAMLQVDVAYRLRSVDAILDRIRP
jgi:serine/threonine protein kinase